ncbi:haloacid dehalogenase-like hydrolase [unidentified eubacterium SCB49]|nr:haloacid dehalogenase-like hydrolase [unidentified eubacterium SCB49]
MWDFDKNSALAFKRVFEKHHIELSLEHFLIAYNPINFNYWAAFREERVTKQELRRGRLVDTFKKYNIEYSLEKIDLLASSYIDELPGNNHLLPGALDVLNYLNPKYNLHIITNGFHEVQHVKLDKSEIKHYFKTITSSEEVGVKKPNPAVFHAALSKANTEAKHSVMIGDTYGADIVGAQGVGMDALLYNYWNEKTPSGIRIVEHLEDIKNIL